MTDETQPIAAAKIVPAAKIDGLKNYVDLACLTEDRSLLLIGWIFDPNSKVQGMAVLREDGNGGDGNGAARPWLSNLAKLGGQRPQRHSVLRSIEHGKDGVQLMRNSRPDVASAVGSKLDSDKHGFILLLRDFPPRGKIALELQGNRHVLMNFNALERPHDIVKGFRLLSGQYGAQVLSTVRAGLGDDNPLTILLRDLPDDKMLEDTGGPLSTAPPDGQPRSIGGMLRGLPRRSGTAQKALARLGAVLTDLSKLSQFVERPETVVGGVDKGYPLGDAGLLLFGWHFFPKRKPLSISICDEFGNRIEIGSRMHALCRMDVSTGYRPRFGNVDDLCGFACLAPMPTKPGESRAVCYDYGDFGQTWVKAPTDNPGTSGVELVKEILGMVPSPERIRTHLFELFDNGLGQAVEAASSGRRPVSGAIESMQYGTPADAPEFSIVVPLYGRYDFLRHQLAHFANDPDFRSADLIYVVDDPGIATPTMEMAAKYYRLFGVPFRVVWYGENRGYAGANNIGAKLARGRHLLLLNSDVIPQCAGWLASLGAALDTLPDAGMVAPLLQFGDGSIQHAGMYPYSYLMWPGFILNTHKLRGMAWSGGERPSEHPLLTAACVMLRTEDFRRMGGFDEGYVIGDFEDSDLCLGLRKEGKRLYLVPAAKLWHLERQSQNLDNAARYRQMVTLFNAWRYKRKIVDGELADPRLVDLAQ